MTDWEIRLAQYKKTAAAIRLRAKTIEARLDAQARAIGERCGTGREYCYHLAHNWSLGPDVPPKKAADYRKILDLQRRIFRVARIADRMIARECRKMLRDDFRAPAAPLFAAG